MQGLTALVLHVRAYRESSAIVTFFTKEAGRVAGVVHGVRGSKRGARIEPFCTGEISCSGRGSLLSVSHHELRDSFALQGDCLSGGFYVLEVLNRVLGERQPEPQIFHLTLSTLNNLSKIDSMLTCQEMPGVENGSQVLKAVDDGSGGDLLKASARPSNNTAVMAAYLRVFEAELLGYLGYLPDITRVANSDVAVSARGRYRFEADVGVLECHDEVGQESMSGELLMAVSNNDFTHPGALAAARSIYQRALEPLVGTKPLVSRSLWQSRANTSTTSSGKANADVE